MNIGKYLMVCAAGRIVNFFGLFNLPNLIGENEAWGDVFFQLHEKLAYIFLLIVGIIPQLHYCIILL